MTKSEGATWPIVGMYFRPPAQAIIDVLPSGCALILEPEPTNEYDPNALRILVETKNIPEGKHEMLDERALSFGFALEDILAEKRWHLGYLPKTIAAKICGSIPGAVPGTLSFNGSDGKPLFTLRTSEDKPSGEPKRDSFQTNHSEDTK